MAMTQWIAGWRVPAMLQRLREGALETGGVCLTGGQPALCERGEVTAGCITAISSLGLVSNARRGVAYLLDKLVLSGDGNT